RPGEARRPFATRNVPERGVVGAVRRHPGCGAGGPRTRQGRREAMARRAGGGGISLEKGRGGPGAEQAHAQETAPSPRDHIGIILKRRWIIVAFLAIVTAGASVYVWREPNVYRATASIEISMAAPRYLGSGVQDVAESTGGMYWQSKEFF